MLLEKYSGKPVRRELISSREMHDVVPDPLRAPKELSEGSASPVDSYT